MAFRGVTPTQITIGAAGSWVGDVDVGAFVAPANGETFVAIQVRNLGAKQQFGVRPAGSTDTLLTSNATDVVGGYFITTVFIPLGTSNLVDFYTSSTTNCTFWIIGYGNGINFLDSPVDLSGKFTTSYSANAASLADLLPVGAAAEGAHAIVEVNDANAASKLGRVGTLGSITAGVRNVRSYEFVPLNTSREIGYEYRAGQPATANVYRLIGWTDPGVYQTESTQTAYQPSTSGAWEDFPKNAGNYALAAFHPAPGAAGTYSTGFRTDGYSDTSTPVGKNIRYIRPSAAGLVEFYASSTNATGHDFALAGGFLVASSLSSIDVDDSVYSGQTGATYSGTALGDAADLRITSSNTAQTATWVTTPDDADSGTFTATRWNLPYTDLNHTLTASIRTAGAAVLSTRDFILSAPAGFIVLPVSEDYADKTVGDSLLAAIGTIPSYSQCIQPVAAGGYDIEYEMHASGYWTGRFYVIDDEIGPPTAGISVTGGEYRPGDTGVWEAMEFTIDPPSITTEDSDSTLILAKVVSNVFTPAKTEVFSKSIH